MERERIIWRDVRITAGYYCRFVLRTNGDAYHTYHCYYDPTVMTAIAAGFKWNQW